jgi:hypothetical protein
LTATPRDRFGSYLGPGYADRVQISVPGARALGSVKDGLDGTYTQELWVARERDVKAVEIQVLGTRIEVPGGCAFEKGKG